MPSLDDYPPLSILLEKNPDIVRFATERRVQDAKLRLAESQRTPDVTISAGVKRFQNDRSNAFMLSASIPLGSESRAAPYVSEALSLRDGVMYREQARRAELQSTLFVALEQAKQARKETESLLKRAIPQASEAQTLAEQGYGVGRFSLLELVTAQQQLTDLQRQAINAAASFHQSLLEIEHLTGRSAADRISSNDAGSP
jgi:cobalt-zinc-cadmium efflux system outer membrane protein